MATLAVDVPRSYDLGGVNDLPVIASDIIYEGSAVGENASGYSRPLVAGDPFQGFSLRQADNSTGSAGDITVRLQSTGKAKLIVVGVSAVTANDFPPVYASDDDTFTLTAGANSLIGNVHRWISGPNCIVSFSTPRPPSTVGTADIENEAVTVGKMADLTQGSIYSGQASNRPAALIALTDKQILIGDGTDVISVAVSGDITISNAGAVTIAAASIDLSMLSSGITMSHIVVFAGEFTTAGGDVTETINDVGIAATDIVHVTLHTKGASPVTILTAVAITDNITVTMSADPSTDHVLSYSVLRAAA